MKRRNLLPYLSQQGFQLVREESEHSIWENPLNGRRTAIPRHREIVEFTAVRIFRQLEIPEP
jgi:mRNA interferase HicA